MSLVLPNLAERTLIVHQLKLASTKSAKMSVPLLILVTQVLNAGYEITNQTVLVLQDSLAPRSQEVLVKKQTFLVDLMANVLPRLPVFQANVSIPVH